MRETLRAFATTFGFGFRSAPWHTTIQLVTGVVLAMGALFTAYGGKLVIDAASRGDLRLGLTGGVVFALTTSITLLAVFVYVNSTFAVIERGHAEADRRLMRLLGGGDGLAHHERADYLDQVHRIREDRTHLGSVVNQSAGMLRALASLVMAAILLSSIHPMLLVLLVLGITSFLIGRRARDMEIAAQEATSEAERLRRHFYDLGTTASTGKEMRIFGLTKELVRRHHQVSDRVIDARNRADWRAAALQSIDAVLGAAGYVAAIVVVLLLALDGRATPGDVVLAVGVVAQLDGSMSSAVAYGTNFLRGLAVARRFRWLERYTAEVARVPTDPVPPPDRLREGIELRDVSFGYPETERPTLQDVSLDLPAGAVVALVGENGAGKTTLVKLLSGFYEADAGEVLVDGVDVRRHPVADWQARVSAAFQDHAPFEFPVRETVGVGDLRRIDDSAAVWSALERADADAMVDVLPDGLETQLGTVWDGVDLSGGQWQRLALARGLMREDPLLVVFDEPTAALDPQTEHAMFERFSAAARSGGSHGTVTLLVSHRFSTVRMADLIVVLDGGRVREVGSHQDLIERGDLYAELYELQSRAYR